MRAMRRKAPAVEPHRKARRYLLDRGEADLGLPQHAGEREAGKLATLVGVEGFGLPDRANSSSNAATQKPASIVFDNRQARTLQLAQSMVATT